MISNEMGIPLTDLADFGRLFDIDDVAIGRGTDCDGLLREPVKEQSSCPLSAGDPRIVYSGNWVSIGFHPLTVAASARSVMGIPISNERARERLSFVEHGRLSASHRIGKLSPCHNGMPECRHVGMT